MDQWINVEVWKISLKLNSQKRLLPAGMVKEPCLNLRPDLKHSTDATVSQFRKKIVPHDWCPWAEDVLTEIVTSPKVHYNPVFGQILVRHSTITKVYHSQKQIYLRS